MNSNHKKIFQQPLEEKRIKQLISCLESLSSQNIHRLKSFWYKDIIFDTPLFSAQGKEDALQKYGEKFNALNTQKMRISGYALSGTMENILFLRWDQKLGTEKDKKEGHVISGMSELTWDLDGNKIMHWQDFWNPDPIFASVSKSFKFGLNRAKKAI